MVRRRLPPSVIVTVALCVFAAINTRAAADAPQASPALQAQLQRVVSERLANASPSLVPERVHVAVIDIDAAGGARSAEVNGLKPVYPASVIKMFYMGYVYFLVGTREMVLDADLKKHLYQMIHSSSNVATAWIVDAWSGVRHDAVMTAAEFEHFAVRRNACNRWLTSLGLGDVINANQKTWVTPIPPGEAQFLRDGALAGPYTNRNSMTAMGAVRFLQLIAESRLIDEASSRAMRELMARDVRTQPYLQRRIAGGAPPGATVFGKTGTTSRTFHDAAVVELDNGRRYAVAVLITGSGPKGSIIRDISADFFAGVGAPAND